MKEEHTADRNKLITKIKRIYSILSTGFMGGDFVKGFKYIDQVEQLIKNFKGDVPEEIKKLHMYLLSIKSSISGFKGNLSLSFKAANELLKIAPLYESNVGISDGTLSLGHYYWFSGELEMGLAHLDRAIRLHEENLNDLRDFMSFANKLWMATRFSIDIEDLERAKKYFKRLEEIKELKPANFIIYDSYLMAKAWVLNSSMQSRDRVMAEDLFREIIENDRSSFVYKLNALSRLCELLLSELRVSNDTTIINKIKPLLEKLIKMAQHSGLYYFLVEAYIIHGKMALIVFDMESSRRYFTQAQNLAEKYGYIGLADEIAGLHESMMEKKETWEQMEQTNAPISERMDLARLDDHLKGKFRMRMMKMERVDDNPPKKEVF